MLRLRTLGGLALERDGVPIAGPGTQRKRLALLALLCVESPRGVTRDKLLGFFWAESDEERGRNALYQAVAALRRELGPGALIGSGAGEVRVDEALLACDLFDFRGALAADDLESAVVSYTGAFLDGVFLKDAAEFERWLDDTRGRLAREHRRALETLAKRADSRSDHPAAVRWWRELASADPLSATAATGLMNALATAGDSAAALQHARVHMEVVRSELGVEAEPEVERAVERIRATAAAARKTSVGAQISTPTGSTALDAGMPAAQAPSIGPVEGTMPRAPLRSRRIPWRRAVGVVAVVAAVAMLTLAAHHDRHGGILIVPFENDVGDTALEHLGSVTAHWIESGISHAALGTVVEVGTFADSSKGPTRNSDEGAITGPSEDEATIEALSRIAHESDASLLVWGRISRRGDSLRFEPRLLRPDGRTVVRVMDAVSAPVDQPFQGVEQVRQVVMGALAAESDPRLAAAATPAAHTPRYDAYVQYVRGLETTDLGSPAAAVAHYDTASMLDPEFAEASLALAQVLSMLGEQRRSDSVVAALAARRPTLSPYGNAILDFEHALHATDKELQYRAAEEMARLAPNSPPALWWLGVTATRSNRFYEAVTTFARIENRPWRPGWFAEVYWQSAALHMVGDYSGELALARRAEREYPGVLDVCEVEIHAAVLAPVAELDPKVQHCLDMSRSPWQRASVYQWLARWLRAHRRFDLARVYADSGTAIIRRTVAPGTPPASYGLQLGRLLLAAGRWQQALTALEPVARRGRHPRAAAALLGIAAARAGHLQLADSLRHAFKTDTTGVGLPWALLDRGRITASMGLRDDAVDLLRAALDHGITAAVTVHSIAGLDPLYGYPPFEALLRPVDRPTLLARLKSWLMR